MILWVTNFINGLKLPERQLQSIWLLEMLRINPCKC